MRGASNNWVAAIAVLTLLGSGIEPVGSLAAKTAAGTSAPESAPARVESRNRSLVRAAFAGRGADSLPAALRAQVASPLATDLMTWSELRNARKDDWGKLSTFLARRSGWPGARTLRTKAEWVMPESLAPEDVRAFFADHAPRTGRGARLLGEAQTALGQQEEGRLWIEKGWREEPLTKSEEVIYLANHAKLVAPHTPERIEFLIGRDLLSPALRLAKRLPKGERAFVEARVALLRGRRGVDKKLAAVPARLQDDPRLTYARTVWRARRGRVVEAETLMIEASKAGLSNPDEWADRRRILARDAMEEGRYQRAYDLAAGHGLSIGIDFAELEWFAGWMALRHLDRPDEAQRHFEALWNGVRTPISRARAAYWAAVAAEEAGAREDAKTWAERAAALPSVFYGQLAAETVRGAKAVSFQPKELPRRDDWSAQERDLLTAASLLTSAGLYDSARLFLKRLARLQTTEGGLLAVAAEARDIVGAGGEIQVALIARERGITLWDALYPTPDSPDFRRRATEAALLLGVARQESRFAVSVRSGAGARGLMQVMPRTARAVARRIGARYDAGALTRNPSYNLRLADAYMAGLLREFNGSYLLAVAAYNAGPGNVRKWIRRFGDPRGGGVDPVDWIESIPFRETRNYVQRVLEATQVYRTQLSGGAAPLRLAGDLSR
ncbi:MAG: lytic transglycosylase domain-containing protein [Pseudomonadota bacterium]